MSEFAHDVSPALALNASRGVPAAQEGGAAVSETHPLVAAQTRRINSQE